MIRAREYAGFQTVESSQENKSVQETLGLFPGLLLIHLAIPHLYAGFTLSGFTLDVPSCKCENLLIERTT